MKAAAGLSGSIALLAALAGPAAAQGGYGALVAAADGAVFVAEARNVARSGIVYVYRPGGDGRWAEAAQLKGPGATPGDGFGAAIAADGTTLLASRPAEDAVYVFERRGQGWQQTGKLVPSGLAATDTAGTAVAIRGDVALVAAAGGTGAVYVFRRGAGGQWAQDGKLSAPDAVAGDGFGATLAVHGDRALVGAPAQAKNRGGAYLFARDASGWQLVSPLVSRTVTDGSRLGAAVALGDSMVVVAAPGRDENTGAVYLFEPNPNAPAGQNRWAAFTRLFPYEGSSNSQFGARVAVVGSELWIGSPGNDNFQGAIYRFAWDARKRDWTETRKLSYAEEGAPIGYGAAFAVAGSAALMGLPNADHGEGAAIVFVQNGGEWQPKDRVFSEPESFQRIVGKPMNCDQGKVEVFECGGVELLGFLPLKEIGGKRGIQLNDIWGWTDPTSGKEYALVGRMDGTSFVDISNPTNPVYLGDLPMTQGARANSWRDIKVYQDHAYIVADGAGPHGMQVFDLARLRSVRPGQPQTFTADVTYDRIFSAHNIVINEDKGFAFAVGSNGGGESCGGALHMVDIREPKNPKFAGCFADTETGIQRTGYTHDSQCVTYAGPDEQYRGKEVCFNSSETALGISDVTDKASPKPISRASYPNVAYSHQGWLTDDQRYFYMDDEGDEMNGSVSRTRTIIWDVSDLDDPQVVGEYLGETGAIDHNLYIKGDTMYESNYVSGLRVIDIKDRKNPKEIGFFDSVPNSPNNATFNGSWSNYPYFKSGSVVFTSMREGLFIVRVGKRPVS